MRVHHRAHVGAAAVDRGVHEDLGGGAAAVLGPALEVRAHDHLRGQEPLAHAGRGHEERVPAADRDVALVAADQAARVEAAPHLDDVAAQVALIHGAWPSAGRRTAPGRGRPRSRSARSSAVDRRDQRAVAGQERVADPVPHQLAAGQPRPRLAGAATCAAIARAPPPTTNRPTRRTTSRTRRMRRSPISRASTAAQPPVHARPAQEDGPDGEAGAHRGEERQVALLQPLLVEGGAQGEGDGGRGGVAVALDVLDHLRRRAGPAAPWRRR